MWFCVLGEKIKMLGLNHIAGALTLALLFRLSSSAHTRTHTHLGRGDRGALCARRGLEARRRLGIHGRGEEQVRFAVHVLRLARERWRSKQGGGIWRENAL